MPLEETGFRAVIQGVAAYAANAQRIIASNLLVRKSVQQLRDPTTGRFLSLAQSQLLRQTQATDTLRAASIAATAPITNLGKRAHFSGGQFREFSKDLSKT